jgi:calcium-dependent protein kinase
MEREDGTVYFKSRAKIELEWVHNYFYTRMEEDTQKERYFFKIFKSQKTMLFEVKSKHEYEEWKRFIVPITINNTFFDDFKVLSYISSGSTARVYKVKEKETSNLYACKRFRKKKLGSNGLELIINEIRIMKALQGHPNILQFVSLFESENSIYLITELCHGGRITKKKKIYRNFEIKHIAETLILVLNYMATKYIVHRDLKPDNILLKYENVPIQQNEIKIIDFGLAVDLEREREDKRIMGTVGYMAPESFSTSYTPTSKVDVYSVGVMLYNALTGTKLFADKDQKQMMQNNRVGQVNYDHDTFKLGDNHSKLNSQGSH